MPQPATTIGYGKSAPGWNIEICATASAVTMAGCTGTLKRGKSSVSPMTNSLPGTGAASMTAATSFPATNGSGKSAPGPGTEICATASAMTMAGCTGTLKSGKSSVSPLTISYPGISAGEATTPATIWDDCHEEWWRNPATMTAATTTGTTGMGKNTGSPATTGVPGAATPSDEYPDHAACHPSSATKEQRGQGHTLGSLGLAPNDALLFIKLSKCKHCVLLSFLFCQFIHFKLYQHRLIIL